MNPKIIILSGDRGTGNNGDRAITFNAIERLRTLLKEPDIVFSTPRYTDLSAIYEARFVPGLDQALYGNSDTKVRLQRLIPRVARRLLRLTALLSSCLALRWLRSSQPISASAGPFLDELRTAQLLLIAGGGQFASLWSVSVLVYSAAVFCARLLRVPVVATGLGAGPFDSLRDRLLTRLALNQCELVAARSPSAFENIRAIGVSDRRLVLAADDALTLQKARADEILANPVETLRTLPERYIAAHFRLAPSASTGEGELSKFAALLDRIVDSLEVDVIFVPFAVSDYADDRVAHYQVYAKMHNKHRVHLIHSLYHPQAVKAIIGDAALAVGHGLHFCTFALSSGVPAIGLYKNQYYRDKLGGLFETFGVRRYALDSSKLDADQLVEHVSECYENRREITDTLRAHYAEQAHRWDELYVRVASIAQRSFPERCRTVEPQTGQAERPPA
jgi:polysaccharide pyruvyl transferase WcaK-like protein